MICIRDIIENRYEVIKEIGRGGMSVVYLANDINLDKKVAIKDIKRESNLDNEFLRERIRGEISILKELRHQSLAYVQEVIYRGDDIYIVMDYVEGRSLKEELKSGRKFTADEVIELAKQIAEVLDYIHTLKNPIVYKDMKPDNIMLMPNGRIKLIDFGISIENTVNGEEKKNFGTKIFMSPEQAEGKNVDSRSDIYSLGVTLHNILLGRIYKKNNKLVPIREIDKSLPEGLQTIINKCTEYDRENRYSSCKNLKYQLENIEKLESDYKWKVIKEMKRFLMSASAFILFIVVAIVGHVGNKGDIFDEYKGLMNEADTYIINGEYTEAIKVLDKAILKVDGSNEEAYEKIINIYTDMGNPQEGLNKVEGYIYDEFENVNKNDDVLLKVAMTYMNMNNHDIALKYFQMINEKDIPDAKYYKTLTTSLSSMNIDYSKILSELVEFEKFTDKLPNGEKKLTNYNSLANIYISNKGNLKDANDKVIEIIDKAYSNLKTLNNETLNMQYEYDFLMKLAQTYHSKGVTINLNPDSTIEEKASATEYLDEAIKNYKYALLDISADKETILIRIGEVYNELGDTEKSIKQFDEVISEYPDSIRAYIKKADTYLDIEEGKQLEDRNYAKVKSIYNDINKHPEADSNVEFNNLKRRMINLELL